MAAAVIGRDDAADLALLRASGAGLAPLAFADYDALRLGETLGAAGYPDVVSGSPSVTDGLLSKFVTYDGIAYIQTSAEISPGNSGGPLFTACGAVAGVNVLKRVGPAIEGISFAVTLPTIRDRLPRLRAGQGSTSPTEPELTPLEVVAVCNSYFDEAGEPQAPESFEDCLAAGASGFRTGSGWGFSAWIVGVEIWDNVVYRFDGGDAVTNDGLDRSVDQLTPGQHTLEANEQRGGQWTGWSAPYPFTVVVELEIAAACNQRLNWEQDEWQVPSSIADCRVAGVTGIHTGYNWGWSDWLKGVVERDNVVYRFDGGAAVRFGDGFYNALHDLSPGSHTVAIREQRPWGWTEWSAPYAFATVATLEILAICNNNTGTSFTIRECKAAEQAGISPYVAWQSFANGVVQWGNVAYSFDGGPGALAADALAGLSPTLGVHYYQIRELRSWGWTDWSEPYSFTVSY